MPEPIELNVLTITGGQQGTRVRVALASDCTIGQVKAALSERGCGPAAEITLILNSASPTDATLIVDLDNPSGLMAVTPMQPTAGQGLTVAEDEGIEEAGGVYCPSIEGLQKERLEASTHETAHTVESNRQIRAESAQTKDVQVMFAPGKLGIIYEGNRLTQVRHCSNAQHVVYYV